MQGQQGAPPGGFTLPRSVAALFGQPIVVVNQAALSRAPWASVREEAAQLINHMGRCSAIAQGLVGRGGPNPITVVNQLGETEARVYILAQQEPGKPPVAVGLLKIGCKSLFHFDGNGKARELPHQLSVLDFYVHEDWQRGGYGKMLFFAMLQNEGVPPHMFAYDRPSPKLIGFMSKHFGLSEYVPQQNKFVIFSQFFSQAPAAVPSIYDSVKDRPLTARNRPGQRR